MWRKIESEIVELPEAISAMRSTDDGRLLVTLASGRVIDMTEWFAEPPAPPADEQGER